MLNTRSQAVARINDRTATTASQQTLLISDYCEIAFAPMKLLQSHRRVPWLTERRPMTPAAQYFKYVTANFISSDFANSQL